MILNLPSQTDLSGFYVVFNGSAYIEKSGMYGMSHLIEHLVCKNFKPSLSDFERKGINYNAFTADNKIVFLMTGLDKYVSELKYNFIDMITSGVNVTEEVFETERQIVYEEYLDFFNKQSWVHYFNLMRVYYDYYGAIGRRNDILNFTYNDCMAYYGNYMTAPSAIINVSKDNDFEREEVLDTSEPTKEFTRGIYNVEKEKIQREDKVSIFDFSPEIHEDIPEVKLICSMLAHGMDSPLTDEIREKRGLTYGVGLGPQDLGNKVFVHLEATTTKSKVDKFKETVDYVFNNKKKFMTKERFDIIMEACGVMKDKQEILRYKNVGEYISKQEHSLLLNLDRIEYDKVMDVYDEHFDINKYTRTLDSDPHLNKEENEKA